MRRDAPAAFVVIPCTENASHDTCFDTRGKWDISSFLPFIDFLFVNDLELKHIAKGNTMQKRVGSLFKTGSRVVAVKQAGKGATLFVKGLSSKHFPSVAHKAVDTTGAGDAFNAGFVFGLMNAWSLDSCMRSGNFVAAKKIQVHGLAAPTARAVKRFVAMNHKPTVAAANGGKDMGRLAARETTGKKS